MTRQRITSAPGISVLAFSAMVAGCLEPPFAHTNINDPLAEFAVTFDGVPDTVRRFGQRFTTQVVTTPDAPYSIQTIFGSSSPADLFSWLDGSFEVRRQSAAPVPITVSARRGVYVLEQEVAVYSEVGSLEVECGALTPTCAPIPWLNGSVAVRAIGRLPGPLVMADVEYALANRGGIVARDTNVVWPAEWSFSSTYMVRARANGQTWVVFTADQSRDSVFVTVSQVVDRWTLRCPAGLRVGDVGRISATDPVDLGGSPVPGVGPVEWLPSDRAAWTGDATVELGGEVTALAAGTIYVQGNVPSLANREWGFCAIQIQP